MQKFPASLCILSPRPTALGAGNSDSLQNVNIAELPDGAECWVIDIGCNYRLYKQSVLAASGLGIIVPNGAAVGRWVQESGVGAHLSGDVMMDQAIGQAITTLVQNRWAALPSGSSFYAIENSSPIWTVDSTTGIMTYTGSSQTRYSIRGYASMQGNTGNQEGDFASSINGALIGGTTTVNYSSQSFMGSSQDQAFAFEHILLLTNGDTVQGIVRNRSATPGDLTLNRYRLVASPLP